METMFNPQLNIKPGSILQELIKAVTGVMAWSDGKSLFYFSGFSNTFIYSIFT